MSMLSNVQPQLSQQQQLFTPEARAALSPVPAERPEEIEDDRPLLIPCNTTNAGINLHR